MKNLCSLLLGIGVMAFGIWLSIFVMFIPGLTSVISQCHAETISASILAIAATKIIFAGPVMEFCFGFARGLWKGSSK